MRTLELALTVLIGGILMTGTAFAGVTQVQIPEPASLGLIAVGAGGVALLRRLRRRK